MATQQLVQLDQARSLPLYGYGEEPVCCPRCGVRTFFEEVSELIFGMPQEAGLQLHRCLGECCDYVFLAAEVE